MTAKETVGEDDRKLVTEAAPERSALLEKWAKRSANISTLSIIPLLIWIVLLFRWNLLETQQLLLQQSELLRHMESRCSVDAASTDFSATKLRRRRSIISEHYEQDIQSNTSMEGITVSLRSKKFLVTD